MWLVPTKYAPHIDVSQATFSVEQLEARIQLLLEPVVEDPLLTSQQFAVELGLQHACYLMDHIEPRFRPLRLAAERKLFDGRWAHFCNTESKVMAFLLANALVELLQARVRNCTPEDLHRFQERYEEMEPPEYTFCMPLEECGSFLAQPERIEQGNLHLTYPELRNWLWDLTCAHQEAMSEEVIFRGDFLLRKNKQYIHPLARQLEQLAHLVVRHLDKTKRKRDPSAGSLVQADIEDVALFAKTKMPPCVAADFYNALEHRQHPQDRARYHMVSLMAAEGMSLEDIDAVLLELWRAEMGSTLSSERMHQWYNPQHLVGKVQEGKAGPASCATKIAKGECPLYADPPYAAKVIGWMDVHGALTINHFLGTDQSDTQHMCAVMHSVLRPELKPRNAITHPGQWLSGAKTSKKQHVAIRYTK